MAIVPFWFSREHHWIALTPFLFSGDDTRRLKGLHHYENYPKFEKLLPCRFFKKFQDQGAKNVALKHFFFLFFFFFFFFFWGGGGEGMGVVKNCIFFAKISTVTVKFPYLSLDTEIAYYFTQRHIIIHACVSLQESSFLSGFAIFTFRQMSGVWKGIKQLSGVCMLCMNVVSRVPEFFLHTVHVCIHM